MEADAALAALKEKKTGESSGTFSYRVVAKPRTEKKLSRLEKFAMPTITVADKPPRDIGSPAPPKKP